MKLIPDVSKFMESSKERSSNPKSSMHSLELVITVLLFVLLGRYLDSRFDTTPFLTLIVSFIGISGSFLSAFYRYQATSKKMEKDKVWAKTATRKEVPSKIEEPDDLVVPKGYGNND